MVPSFSCVDSALLGHEYGKLLGWLYVNKLPRWIGDFGGLDASIGWSLRWIGRDVSVDRADLVVLAMLMTLNYFFFLFFLNSVVRRARSRICFHQKMSRGRRESALRWLLFFCYLLLLIVYFLRTVCLYFLLNLI